MRAGPAGFSGRACRLFLGGRAAGLQAFLGGLSLNRIFCSKDSLPSSLRKSPKYETSTISNSIIVALPLPYSIHQPDQGLCRPMKVFKSRAGRAAGWAASDPGRARPPLAQAFRMEAGPLRNTEREYFGILMHRII